MKNNLTELNKNHKQQQNEITISYNKELNHLKK